MVQFKKLTTSLPGGTNTYTFTDALINDASVIEVYTDNDDVYPVNLEQHENSIDITLSDHADAVGVALTINNVITYEPVDISGLENEIQTVSDNLTGLSTVVNELSDNVDTIEGDVSKVNQDLTQYEQNGFLSRNLIEKIYEQGQPSSEVNTRVRVKNPIKIEQGKKYSFKFTTDISNGQYIVLTSSRKDYLWTETTYCGNVANWGRNDYTFQATNDGFLAIAFRKSNNTVITVSECEKTYIMASESETALDYMPYAPSNIELKKMIDEGGGGGSGSQQIYDDTERVIGTWFNKPLYRKVVSFHPTTQTFVEQNFPHNISNIENVVRWEAFLRFTSGTVQQIPSTQFNTSGVQYASNFGAVNKTNCTFYQGLDRSAHTCFYIIEYTKEGD